MMWAGRRRSAEAGFTLIETLVAMVLMGMILTGVTVVTAQWLPNWDRGFARTQRSELVSIVLDRLVADIGAAQFVTANRDSKLPVFEGNPLAVTLIRSAFGPNTQGGLEAVRVAEALDRDGIVLVRSRASFVPGMAATTPGLMNLSDPVELLRPPFRVTFAYAGRDGNWRDTWHAEPLLPSVVRVTVRDAISGRTLSISTAALVHVEIPAACVRASNKADCASRPDQATDAPQNGTPQAPGSPGASPTNQPSASQTL